jgi:hypothetical protein
MADTYLLTLQIQMQGDSENSRSYISNEVTELSPELWLAKKIRSVKESGDNMVIVITNCIIIPNPNPIAVKKIGENNWEIIEGEL